MRTMFVQHTSCVFPVFLASSFKAKYSPQIAILHQDNGQCETLQTKASAAGSTLAIQAGLRRGWIRS